MIPKECKRLAEVDFPIAVVSKHSAREKSIRHGHPSTLHLWWARRPLAACRSMLLGLLLPDPCDKNCPEDFKEKARKLLPMVQGTAGTTDLDLRKALLKFIGDFANWDLSTDRTYLEVSRGLVKAAHPEETPLVVDPFAGGGSIPLEALRLGCETFASDLNPVACLILKVMLEDIPRHGPELAEELRKVGKEIKEAAEKELAEFYPPDPDGSRPIAYLWARTIKCESPNCGAEIPLMRSFWLSKKAGRKRALKYNVVRPQGKSPHIEFEIFEPKNDKEVPDGTVTRAKATCPCCNIVLSPERVRAQLREQRGGADVIFNNGNRIGGAKLLAVVTLKSGELGRKYRLPTEQDYKAVWMAQKQINKIINEWESSGRKELCPVPDEPTPIGGGSGAGRAFSVQNYGMMKFKDMFTSRQNLTLLTFSKTISTQNYITRPISLAFGKLVDLSNVICPWEPNAECPRNVLSLGRIKTAWDFAEGVAISESSGSFSVCIENLAKGVLSTRGIDKISTPEITSAQKSPLPTESCDVWFTDPPYYDAIPYSDLSDMFFVWYKRALPKESLLKDPFDISNPLTPKDLEATQDDARMVNGKGKDKEFFEKTMTKAFSEGRRVLRESGIASVVFAHKTTEGWEALLSGMIGGNLVVTGSWPIKTEQEYRLRARESAALATSVHLVCRPRPEDAPVGDWGDVLRELPNRVGDWMERLQSEHIRGADLVFACIGPALEIYSKYSKVVDAQEREIPLGGDPNATEPYKRGYLSYVWEVIGRVALEQILGTSEARVQNGAASVLEEDARLTALFLWTLQSTNGEEVKSQKEKGKSEGIEENEIEDDEDEEATSKAKPKGFSLVFDVVRRFAQPLGIHLPEWEGRILETKKGVVRLMSVTERAKQLFGDDSGQAGMTGIQAVAEQLESDSKADMQTMLFPEMERHTPVVKGRRGRVRSRVNISEELLETKHDLPDGKAGATTLDRVHAAMLLQAGGRANALRALLKSEQERGPEFLRLANALSALYPKGSEEKRLLDAMLLAVPR